MPSRSTAAEPPPGRSRRMPSRRRGAMPWQAMVATGLGLFGVVPLAFVVFIVYALGGLDADTARDWRVYPLGLAPVLLLVGCLRLAAGRGRAWLLVGAAAAVAAAAVIIGVGRSAGEPVALGPLILAVCPVLAAGVALAPAVGRWLADSGSPPS